LLPFFSPGAETTPRSPARSSGRFDFFSDFAVVEFSKNSLPQVSAVTPDAAASSTVFALSASSRTITLTRRRSGSRNSAALAS
jgi:hypothetical protein